MPLQNCVDPFGKLMLETSSRHDDAQWERAVSLDARWLFTVW
jgi:hypothetical protein